MFEWVGATIFFVVLFLALGYGRGLAASLMSALIYPALQLVGFFCRIRPTAGSSAGPTRCGTRAHSR